MAWLTMLLARTLRLTAIRRISRSDTGMVNNAGRGTSASDDN